MTQVKVKKLHPAASIPKYANPGDACFDLCAVMGDDPEGTGSAWVNVGTPVTARTGLSFEVPDGQVMLIFSRSGHGFNQNIRLSNAVGVIDAGYRGEVKVKLTRDLHGGAPMEVRTGDRIAQAMLLPVERVSFYEVDELGFSVRGTGGFGSSGQ